ncbi:MAG: FAD-dependent oxidoreductase [Rhizobiaceae bacterium]|nr:FAD-dependent oxidoreductase [Rhizobiaceae bacterium]
MAGSSKPLPSSASHVIIGGGITGVSTLYHLGKRGVSDAVLVERKQLACGTTWHAAGIVGQLRESGSQTELAKYTSRLFQSLEEETGQATGYKQNGTINIAISELRMDQLRRNCDHAQRMGVEGVMLDVEQLRERVPWLNYQDILGGFMVPSNGQVNPLDVTQALAKGARQNGCQIFENVAATRILTDRGRVCGVATDKGVIATEKVLLAGGMWSAQFARQHGVAVPLHAAEHYYIVTEPMAGLSRELPGLVVAEERIYWKEEAGKLLIGWFEESGKAWGGQSIPDSFEFDELPIDMDHVEPMLATIFSRMPALENMGIQTFFCGPESFTPDGRPYLGPALEMPGLFIAAGMNSNGILNSGGVGLTMSEWLIDGAPGRGMGPLQTNRAMPFQINLAYNAERVTEAIGLHYGLHWPGRQIETARGVRRVPLHDRLANQGAMFAERVGWEVPMYYDSAAKSWPTNPSNGYQEWFPQLEAECLCARDDAVLLDQSMYAKIIVQGPDAQKALNRVCGAQMGCAVSQSIYTQFLNAKGGIEADVTITRLRTDKYIVITGHPSQIRDQVWIRDHADPEWRFEIFDATAAYALLTLHGPNSRSILSALSHDDISSDALSFGAAREIDLAHARVWAIRRSFLGELGFELLIPTEFAAHVYDSIMEQRAETGLRHMGMFAMNTCRLEKGFRHFGHDIAEEDTPYEAGLGFAVDISKEDAFLGQEVLAAQCADGPATRHRTVSLALREADRHSGPFLLGNEPILVAGEVVGHVTSGAWGFRVGRCVGLASLHLETGVSNTWLADTDFVVRIAGRDYEVDVQPKPFYDPTGERMRA